MSHCDNSPLLFGISLAVFVDGASAPANRRPRATATAFSRQSRHRTAEPRLVPRDRPCFLQCDCESHGRAHRVRQGTETRAGDRQVLGLSDGGKKIVFHLRDDVQWSDGKKVRAQDFEYSWKRLLNPKTASQYAYILFDIVNAARIRRGKTQGPVGSRRQGAGRSNPGRHSAPPGRLLSRYHDFRSHLSAAPGYRRKVRQPLDRAGKYRHQRSVPFGVLEARK